MLKLDLTEQERNALMQMIHLAVQARGMEVAEIGVALVKKLQSASSGGSIAPAEPPKVADAG